MLHISSLRIIVIEEALRCRVDSRRAFSICQNEKNGEMIKARQCNRPWTGRGLLFSALKGMNHCVFLLKKFCKMCEALG